MKVLTAAVKSWKTTTLACLAAAAAIIDAAQKLLDSDPATNPDWSLVIGLLVVAVGLVFSRDSDKASEDVGIK